MGSCFSYPSQDVEEEVNPSRVKEFDMVQLRQALDAARAKIIARRYSLESPLPHVQPVSPDTHPTKRRSPPDDSENWVQPVEPDPMRWYKINSHDAYSAGGISCFSPFQS